MEKRMIRKPVAPTRKQSGSVAIMTGVSIFALVGFIGLVVDLGHLFIVKTELQNGCDACALAAARGLNGLPANTAALQPSVDAGIAVGNQNRVNYQSRALAFTSADITFSATLNGTYQTMGAVAPGDVPNLKYARCTLPENGIATYFMHVLGNDTADVAATAVATLAPSQATCAIPIGVCAQNAGAPPNFGLTSGTWYSGKFGSNPDQGGQGSGGGPPEPDFSCAVKADTDGGFTGSYNWIDFSPPGGGANELKDGLAGPGACNLPPVGTPVGDQGQKVGADAAWNTRFGLYKGSYNAGEAAPDFTGVSYNCTNWGATGRAYAGANSGGGATANYLSSKSSRLKYQADNPAGLKNSDGIPSTTDHAANGTNRRVAVAPVVNCELLAGSNPQQVPILGYACVLMISPVRGPDNIVIEYLGRTDTPTITVPGPGGNITVANPCASSGRPGGATAGGPLVPTLVQ